MRKQLLALVTAPLLAAPAVASDDLIVGDTAPELTVAEWIQGEPVEAFREDHTYVIEFWATWCPPCRKSIPHLTKLQEKYGERVTIIGISISEDDQRVVAPFVQKMGDAMRYTVATDLVTPANETGSMATSWMAAAGQKSIPAVFIVRGGRINWIGSPFEMDDPLAQIVEGKWDLAKAIEKAHVERERDAKMRPLYEKLNKAKYARKWDAALQVIDEIIALDGRLEVKYGGEKFEYMLRLKAYDRAYAYGRAFVAGPAWDHAAALNYVAWMIVDPEMQHDRKDLELAMKAAVRADELTDGEDPAIIDTLAKVYFDQGKVEKAIELQKKAVRLAPQGTPLAEELKSRLDQYEKAVSSTEG